MRKPTCALIFLLSSLVFGLFACSATKDSQTTSSPEILAEHEAVKLSITEEGMYRLRLADLGWEEEAGENITLTHKGQPVQYWLDHNGEGSALVFYGQASTSAYTPENTYVLRRNSSGARSIDTQMMPDPEQPPRNYFVSTIHLEENLLYTPKVDQGSPWHWRKIVAPQAESIEFELPQAIDGPGQLRVALWGTTTAPTSPDHHIRVSLNNQVIGEAAWDEQSWLTLEADIPAGILDEENNIIEIHATGETEARIDIVNLDWIEIDYAKSADRIEGQEFFRTPEEPVQLAGFEGMLTIFDISDPSEISRFEPPQEESDPFIFQGDPHQRYLLVPQDGYFQPKKILPLAVSPNLRSSSGTSYIAIGDPELLEPLAPLLQAREAQGLETLTIPSGAIYDQFNGGMPEPEAIQQFLAFAAENWEIPPEYVLLVGDTSYDYYGYLTPPAENFLPTFLVPTVFGGETGSDVLMAQINTDPWPDLALGRVPARTPAQVKTFVDKTLNFEQQSSTEDQSSQSILAIADGQEPSFREDAEHFLEQFPQDYQTELIAPEAGAQGTNQQITAELESGKLLAAYFGHGSIDMWGKDSLFTTQDSADLDNGDHFSIILNFTCLTGLFTHPTEESLAESLLFNPDGGAVAVLAPTSPTLPTDQSFLSDAFIEGMLPSPRLRLGQIALYAWRQVPTDSPSALDVMQTFLLFGDPALQMPSP